MKKLNLEKRKAIQPFLEKNVNEKRKGISPLIATILLIVVAVAIIAIILTWSRTFADDSLSTSPSILDLTPSHTSHYIFGPKTEGFTLFFTYSPPRKLKTQTILITSYSLPGSNTILPLDENISLREGFNSIPEIDLSSFDISDRRTDLVLITSNNEYITLRNVDLFSYIFPPKICGGLPYIEDSGSYLCIHPTGNGIFEWACDGQETGATSYDDGKSNTEAIVATCSDLSFAAKICDDLEYGGFNDWYLPATNQLQKMYVKRDDVIFGDYEGEWNSYSSELVWSSTEFSLIGAYIFFMDVGWNATGTKTAPGFIRCVRDH